MEVSINKEKLWKRKIIENIGILLLGILIFPIMKFVSMVGEENFSSWTILLTGAYLIFVFTKLWLDKLYCNTLKYEVEEDRLVKSWKTITKTKDSARLQIINSIDITQTLFDKIFDTFDFQINYGMGNGHHFSFPYISEEDANKLMDIIKPTGKNILVR